MMDACTDPTIERVVLMTSSRVGKTQCINNLVGYHIHQDPAPILMVLPTEKRAEEWADDEFDPMVRDTPVLRSILGERKSRAAKQRRTHRVYPGGRLYMVGANAPSGLAAKTVRLVLQDEIDRFPPSAGEEGDPVTLAEKRSDTIWNRKRVLSSTPTIAGRSRIEAAYQESDQRRFFVPCPARGCGHMQHLRWPQVRWPEGKPREARYHCEKCDIPWDDAMRWRAVRRGAWRATALFRGTAGFHLNEMYSPFRRLGETAQEFADAKDHPARLKVFVNTSLGETWAERGDAPDWQRLVERAEDFPMGEVPEGAVVLTAGADLQRDRIEGSVWGWSRGLERWLVDTAVFPGRPSDPEPWDALGEWLRRDWPHARGGTMRVSRACVDTGGEDTAAAYGHVRRLAMPATLSAIKGVDSWSRSSPVTGPTMVDALVDGRKVRRGLKLWTVAVSLFKAELYRALHTPLNEDGSRPAGWVHLPAGLGAEPVKQLVAEELRTVKDRRGFARQEWAKLRDRNEQLDMAVYARAALWLAGADRYGERWWSDREAAVADMAPSAPHRAQAGESLPPAPPRPATKAPVRARRQGYFGGWR